MGALGEQKRSHKGQGTPDGEKGLEEPSAGREREGGMAEQRQKQHRELSQVGKPVSGADGCVAERQGDWKQRGPRDGEREAEIQGDGEQRKRREKVLWKVKEVSGVSRDRYKERKREKGRKRREEKRRYSGKDNSGEKQRRELNRLIGRNTPSWRKKGA